MNVVEQTWQREQDALAELKTMSNWRRWGEADELGSLNLVTEDVVRRAATLVRTGSVYPLGEVIGPASVSWTKLPRATHFMNSVRIGEGFGERAQGSTDGLLIPAMHGTVTHIDMFCHIGREGSLYNGIPNDVVGVSGAARLGAENLRGIVSRGVLLDVAGVKNVTYLDGDYMITVDDLEEAAGAAGVEIDAGDAVLIRTGWRNRYPEDPQGWGEIQPGIGPSAGLYLARRDICLVGSDNIAVEAQNLRADKSGDARVAAGVATRLHPRFLGDLGIYLLELLNLDEIAAAGLTEFQFCLAPLLIQGGTTSPVNPLAIC